MENYGDPGSVELLLNALNESVTDDMILYALSDSDTWINQETEGIDIPVNTPDAVKQAAEYYAVSTLLYGIYNVEESENSTAKKYEERAVERLKKWIQSQDTPTDTNYYRNSQSPQITSVDDWIINKES